MTSPSQPPAAGVPVCYRHPGRESHIRCQRCDRPICPDCMRDASVGFHCPTCVAEGAKSVRQARTAYGGLRPTNASITSIGLIGVNVFVWVLILVTGWQQSRLVGRLALSPLGECRSQAQADQFYPGAGTRAACSSVGDDGLWLPGVADGAYWQLLTSVFTHVQVWHIAFNMLALWVLGPQLEMVLGRARFLALYLLSGVAGSAMVLWATSPTSSTVGASGAIFGLMGALLVVAYKVRGNVRDIGVWIAINAVITFVIPNVSWQGHLGGFLGGVLIGALLVYAPRPRRTQVQVLGLVGISGLLALAVILRVAQLA